MANYTLKEKSREMIVYASTKSELDAIQADPVYIKHGIIISSGKHYLKFPDTETWVDYTTAEAEAIAELEAQLDANRIYNTASSAAVCSFSDGADNIPMKSLIAEIAPVQDLHGQANPYPAGGGKNLIDFKAMLDGWGATYTDSGNYTYVITNAGTGYSSPYVFSDTDITVSMSAASLTNGAGASGWRIELLNADNTVVGTINQAMDGTAPVNKSACKIRLNYGTAGGGCTISKLQLESGSSATAFAPYSNICPISGWDGVTVTHTDGDDYSKTYSITLPGTEYGGSLDVISGALTVTDANIASYAGETLPGTWISDRDVYAQGTTPTTGAQVVYKLAEPLVYQLDAITIESLLGTNNLFADTGNTSATYCADPKMYIDSAIASAVAALS